jgi:hypothetical protein
LTRGCPGVFVTRFRAPFIRLNHANADEKMDVLSLIFHKRKSNQAYIEVAHYYFDQGVTPNTMVSKVNESQLSAIGISLIFKRICIFSSKNKKKLQYT